MRIGQDVSIQTCWDEGYMVMDYPVYKFRKDPKNVLCTFTKSYPLYVRRQLCWSVTKCIIYLDMDYSWNDLYDIYKQHEEGVNNMIGAVVGCTYADIELPELYQVLNLASDLDMYCGIGD